MGRKLFWRAFGVTASLIAALVSIGDLTSAALAQVNPRVSDIRPFIGTWTAVHLELRLLFCTYARRKVKWSVAYKYAGTV